MKNSPSAIIFSNYNKKDTKRANDQIRLEDTRTGSNKNFKKINNFESSLESLGSANNTLYSPTYKPLNTMNNMNSNNISIKQDLTIKNNFTGTSTSFSPTSKLFSTNSTSRNNNKLNNREIGREFSNNNFATVATSTFSPSNQGQSYKINLKIDSPIKKSEGVKFNGVRKLNSNSNNKVKKISLSTKSVVEEIKDNREPANHISRIREHTPKRNYPNLYTQKIGTNFNNFNSQLNTLNTINNTNTINSSSINSFHTSRDKGKILNLTKSVEKHSHNVTDEISYVNSNQTQNRSILNQNQNSSNSNNMNITNSNTSISPNRKTSTNYNKYYMVNTDSNSETQNVINSNRLYKEQARSIIRDGNENKKKKNSILKLSIEKAMIMNTSSSGTQGGSSNQLSNTYNQYNNFNKANICIINNLFKEMPASSRNINSNNTLFNSGLNNVIKNTVNLPITPGTYQNNLFSSTGNLKLSTSPSFRSNITLNSMNTMNTINTMNYFNSSNNLQPSASGMVQSYRNGSQLNPQSVLKTLEKSDTVTVDMNSKEMKILLAITYFKNYGKFKIFTLWRNFSKAKGYQLKRDRLYLEMNKNILNKNSPNNVFEEYGKIVVNINTMSRRLEELKRIKKENIEIFRLNNFLVLDNSKNTETNSKKVANKNDRSHNTTIPVFIFLSDFYQTFLDDLQNLSTQTINLFNNKNFVKLKNLEIERTGSNQISLNNNNLLGSPLLGVSPKTTRDTKEFIKNQFNKFSKLSSNQLTSPKNKIATPSSQLQKNLSLKNLNNQKIDFCKNVISTIIFYLLSIYLNINEKFFNILTKVIKNSKLEINFNIEHNLNEDGVNIFKIIQTPTREEFVENLKNKNIQKWLDNFYKAEAIKFLIQKTSTENLPYLSSIDISCKKFNESTDSTFKYIENKFDHTSKKFISLREALSKNLHIISKYSEIDFSLIFNSDNLVNLIIEIQEFYKSFNIKFEDKYDFPNMIYFMTDLKNQYKSLRNKFVNIIRNKIKEEVDIQVSNSIKSSFSFINNIQNFSSLCDSEKIKILLNAKREFCKILDDKKFFELFCGTINEILLKNKEDVLKSILAHYSKIKNLTENLEKDLKKSINLIDIEKEFKEHEIISENILKRLDEFEILELDDYNKLQEYQNKINDLLLIELQPYKNKFLEKLNIYLLITSSVEDTQGNKLLNFSSLSENNLENLEKILFENKKNFSISSSSNLSKNNLIDLLLGTINNFLTSENKITLIKNKLENLLQTNGVIYDILNIDYCSLKNLDEKISYLDKVKKLLQLITNIPKESEITKLIQEKLINLKSNSFPYQKIENSLIVNTQDNQDILNLILNKININNFSKTCSVNNEQLIFLTKNLFNLLYSTSSHEPQYSSKLDFDEFYKIIKKFETKLLKKKVVITTLIGKNSNSNNLIYKDLFTKESLHIHSQNLEFYTKLEKVFSLISEFSEILKEYIRHRKEIILVFDFKAENSNVDPTSAVIDEEMLINIIKVMLALYLKIFEDSILDELKEFVNINMSHIVNLINLKNEFMRFIVEKYPKLFYLSEEDFSNFLILLFDFNFNYDRFSNEEKKIICDKINYYYSKMNKYNITFEINNDLIVGLNENWSYYLEFQNKIIFNSNKDLLEYFNEVDNEARFTLKFDLINSLDNFSKINFFEWIFSQPNQIIICNLNLIFVNEVTQVLISSMELNAENLERMERESKKSDKQDVNFQDKEKMKTKMLQKNIKSEFEILSNKLNSWIDLISKKISSFSRNNNNNTNQNIFANYSKNKCNIANFILTIQNQKNILENLIQNKICDLDNYEWLKYIRHLWDSAKKEIIVECGGWSTYQQYNFIGSYSRLLITPETDKIFLFTASCFREKSAAVVKINSNAQGYLEIYKDFAANFWIDVISLDVSKDDENFSFTKKIFDVSTITKKWIFLENIDNIKRGKNATSNSYSERGNMDSLVFLSKIMQIIQQEIILNEIKQSESQESGSKVDMFCLMGILKIENNLFPNSFTSTPLLNIKNKEIIFKSSSRVLNLIKPDLRFFLNNVFIILGCNIKILPNLSFNILSNAEKLIQNKMPNFYFDFYLLNLLKNNLFKIFSTKVNSSTPIGLNSVPTLNSFNNLSSHSSMKNNVIEIKGYLRIIFETIYPLMKNLLFNDDEIFEMILNHVKGMLSATELGGLNNLREIFESLYNINLENKIKNFLDSNNKIYLDSHIKIMTIIIDIFERNSLKINDNLVNDTENSSINYKKKLILPLIYGEPGVGKSSLISNTIEFMNSIMKKDLSLKNVNEYELIINSKSSLYPSQLLPQYFLPNEKSCVIHMNIIDKNILNSLFSLFLNSNCLTSSHLGKIHLIIESLNIKNLSISEISNFYLLPVQPLKYKKLLKIFIQEIIQKLKQNGIIISDEYNLSIVDYITKLFSAISSDNYLSERFLYYKALELFSIMNLHLNIFIKNKNENASESILFNILVQSVLIIFNNNVDFNFYEGEKGEKNQLKNNFYENEKILKNVLKNIKNLTKSIIKPEICKELNVYLGNEFDFCLNLETFYFQKYDKIESIKNFGSKILIYPANYAPSEYLFKLSYLNRSNLIIVGKQGCGKSTFINYCLSNVKNRNTTISRELMKIENSIQKIFYDFSQLQTLQESLTKSNETIIIIDDLNIDGDFKDIICLNNYQSFLKSKNLSTTTTIFEMTLSEHTKNNNNTGSTPKSNLLSCESYECFYKLNKILFHLQDNSLLSLYKITTNNIIANTSSETKKLYLNKFVDDYTKEYTKNLEIKDLKYLQNASFLLDEIYENMSEIKFNNLISCSFLNSSFYEKFFEKERIENFNIFLTKFVNNIQDKKNNESDQMIQIVNSSEIIKFLPILESKILKFVKSPEYEILIIISQEIIFDVLINRLTQKNSFDFKNLKFEKSIKKLNRQQENYIFSNKNDLEIFTCKIYDQEDLKQVNNNFEIESFIKSKKSEDKFNDKSRDIHKKIILNFEDDNLYFEFSKTTILKETQCLTININNWNLFTPGNLIIENLKKAHFDKISMRDATKSFTQELNKKEVRLNSNEELQFIFYFDSLNKIRELKTNEESVLQHMNSENRKSLIMNQLKSSDKGEREKFNLELNQLLEKPLKRLEEYLSVISSDEYESDLEILISGEDGQQIIKILENLFLNIYSNQLNLKFDFISFISNKFSLIILFKYFKSLNFEIILSTQEKINLFDENFILQKLKSDSELGSILINILEELSKLSFNSNVDLKILQGNKFSTSITNLKHKLPYIKLEPNIYTTNVNPPVEIHNFEILLMSLILITPHMSMKNEKNLLKYIAKLEPYEIIRQLKFENLEWNSNTSSEVKKIIFKIYESLKYQICNAGYQNILLNKDTLTTFKDIKSLLTLPLSLTDNKNSKISILTLDLFENIYNFELLLYMNILSKLEVKEYINFKNSLNTLNQALPVLAASPRKNEKAMKNKILISEILKVIQKPLSFYRKILAHEEFINSDFFYLEQFRELFDERAFLNTKNDYYVNNLLEKIFLSINNKFLLAIFMTIQVMINNSEMTLDESEFLIDIINENFEAGQDSSIKFKTPLVNKNKISKRSIVYAKNLLELYKKNSKTESNYNNFNNESNSINFNLSINTCEILEEIIKKVSKAQSIDINIYMKSLHRDSEKLLFYLIFLEDQSISFFKFLINKYLRPLYTIDHLKINQLLKKRSRFPFSIKSEPNINLTNFLCSLAAFYEIEFFIIREVKFMKLSTEENEIGYKYIIDNDTLFNILEALKNGYWLLITSIIDSKICIKIFDLIQSNEKIIHENFKIFFDLNLINKEDKELKKLIENFTCILNVDSHSVDDLEAAHDIWVNVLDENILSGKI
jgi:hypothetical protein